MAVGARMLLLVSAKKRPAWSCLSYCTGPEMERPGEVCPQAKRASSFLPSLPSFSKCFEKLTPKSWFHLGSARCKHHQTSHLGAPSQTSALRTGETEAPTTTRTLLQPVLILFGRESKDCCALDLWFDLAPSPSSSLSSSLSPPWAGASR